MTRTGFRAAAVSAIIAGLAAGSGAAAQYNEAIRADFIEGCVKGAPDLEAERTFCTCMFEKTKSRIAYADFIAMSEAATGNGETDAATAAEFSAIFSECSAESDARGN